MATPPARMFSSRLLMTSAEYPGVKTLRFKTPDDFDFRPGMWIQICMPDDPKKARAYSIATSPLERGCIEVSLAHVGELTRRLFALRPGQDVILRGPYGRWIFDETASRAVFISEGTGLSPFRSMCRYAIGRKLAAKLTVLYGARNREELLYRSEYIHWRRHGISVYANAGSGVSLEDVARSAEEDPTADFYLCGAAPFIERFASLLRQRGVAQKRIRYEKWGDYSS